MTIGRTVGMDSEPRQNKKGKGASELFLSFLSNIMSRPSSGKCPCPHDVLHKHVASQDHGLNPLKSQNKCFLSQAVSIGIISQRWRISRATASAILGNTLETSQGNGGRALLQYHLPLCLPQSSLLPPGTGPLPAPSTRLL